MRWMFKEIVSGSPALPDDLPRKVPAIRTLTRGFMGRLSDTMYRQGKVRPKN